MPFIVKSDLLTYIDESTIDQLTDGTDAHVDEAIKDAEERIREKISPRFDMDTELVKTGTNRQRSLLKHCINLTIFYLFQRLYTDVLPEGRVEGRDEAEQWLSDVYNGNLNVSLDKIDEANEQGWPLRWGSDTKKGDQTW
jgi:phage gp36-like protein